MSKTCPGRRPGPARATTAAAPARAAARSCHRDTTGRRAWRAGGSLRNDRLRDRRLAYPRPSGARCPRSLSADPSGRAPPGRPCTHRAISRASRLVKGLTKAVLRARARTRTELAARAPGWPRGRPQKTPAGQRGHRQARCGAGHGCKAAWPWTGTGTSKRAVAKPRLHACTRHEPRDDSPASFATVSLIFLFSSANKRRTPT